jgi:branched-chain amino acid transport system substrate-binding protein
MSRIAGLAALAAAMAVTAASPAVAQQPGITADSIKTGSFGALTGPG